MKKFLSILLALAVGFTFTFGSAMSAFAATDESVKFVGYTANEAKNVVQKAYSQAVAEDYLENYDGTVVGTTDITTYTITAANVQKSIDAVYDALYDQILKMTTGNGITVTDSVKTTEGEEQVVTKIGDLEMTGVEKTDVAYVAAYIATQATANSNYLKAAEKASFDDYKTFLIGLVDKVDLSVYTNTDYKDNKISNGYVSKDTKTYKTSVEAANADIAYAKAVIKNAKFGSSADSGSATSSWKVSTYKDLYDAVFGEAEIIKTVPVIDKVSGATTGLKYKLVNESNYSTTSKEASDAATLEATRAAAKAKWAAAVAAYKATDDYVAAEQDANINACIEICNYLIDTADKKTAVSYNFVMNRSNAENSVWLTRIAEGKAYKEDIASEKTKYTALGYNWSDTAAEDAEIDALNKIYLGEAVTVDKNYLTNNKIISSGLTAGAKAAAKIDYSEVAAEEVKNVAASGVTAKLYQLPVSVTYNASNKTTAITDTASNYYFEAQWTKVKAAIDTYNAAVDAASTNKELKNAKYALAEAISIDGTSQIKTASTVYTAVDDVDLTNLNAYAKLIYEQAHAADSTIGLNIYVTFTTVDEAVGGSTNLDETSVNLWYIAKGAETTKEAEAMYKEACAVIDAYKTLTTLKSEAEAVKAKIAALPAAKNIALTDKTDVIDAYDAYEALGSTAQNYVTNKVTLDAAVKAVEPLEAYDVKAKALALPSAALVTIADKEAVKAAYDAYKAYSETEAYTERTLSSAPYSYEEALGTIKTAEAKAIKTAYDALEAKYVSNKLTEEDKEAVDALQKAIAAYIDEYSAAPSTINELDVERLAAAVAALAPEFGDAEAKAYVFDQTVKASSVKLSAKKVEVTANFDASKLTENGYTVEYKFYKSTKKSSGYTYTGITKSGDNATYTNTSAKEGANYYKFKVVVKDADGTVILTTALKDCKYACRTIK